MGSFMAFCLGTLTGGVLGALGMFYLIKETRMDYSMEDSIDLDTPWETEELEMPKEVK